MMMDLEDAVSVCSRTTFAGTERSGRNEQDLSEERDELLEVKKQSKADTFRVRLWRSLVTAALVATATIVTIRTYRLLVEEEQNNFETAYDQFSRTVANAAMGQQGNIREAQATLGDAATAYAESTNATWPLFTLPKFEYYAGHARAQAGSEIATIFNFLDNKNDPGVIDSFISYANETYEEWVEEGHLIEHGNLDRLNPVAYKGFLSQRGPEGFGPDRLDRDYYMSMWTFSPPPTTYGVINWVINSAPDFHRLTDALLELNGNDMLVSAVRPYIGVPLVFTHEEHAAMHSQLGNGHSDVSHPHSFAYRLLHKRMGDVSSPVVGMVGVGFAWDASLRFLLPQGVDGVYAILQNTCNQTFTYELDGPDAYFIGDGDMHEPEYDHMKVFVNLAMHQSSEVAATPGHCQYSMSIYPSRKFEQAYTTDNPKTFAVTVAITFGVVIIVFYVYDAFVQRRNNKLVESNARSNEIVASMFPGQIRDQLLQQGNKNNNRNATSGRSSGRISYANLKSALAAGDMEGNESANKPLADLFVNTTVLFADLAGFTAWSSERSPEEVFLLLETLFSSFDRIAKQRGVFKVETVGDCYVAVTGIPEARRDHAVTMARFARDCMFEAKHLTKKLEKTLGPDTGDLRVRIGLHSGPVTGGVLRGSRARFQIFGDTVNTASRIENTGSPGRVHISKETAAIIIRMGKEKWVTPRADKVHIKGKTDTETFWLSLSRSGEDTETDPREGSHRMDISDFDEALEDIEGDENGLCQKSNRLVDWNVQVLQTLLKRIVAFREVTGAEDRQSSSASRSAEVATYRLRDRDGSTPLDEVKEIIALPEFAGMLNKQQPRSVDEIQLDPKVIEQLRSLVACICTLYKDNSFHNFEHASHVVMSVNKMLARIVAPAELPENPRGNSGFAYGSDELAMTLHDHTYGITSDPLTQFACAFSALIHDVDHTGAPNGQVMMENEALAKMYKNRSVAEQNSLDLSWELLMDPQYGDLRTVLCRTQAEFERFRELVVNSVMATDIADKELKALRNNRWQKAFASNCNEEDARDNTNRKATIVIEHLILASDVSHTMQHWHVYRKWNQRLFEEMYTAFKNGRATKDPAEFWYEGEIGFFDFYIIPLAKKLKECGVFGVSSDEYLQYAIENRREWEARGHEVVAELVQKMADKDRRLTEIKQAEV